MNELKQPKKESIVFFPDETALIKRIRAETTSLNQNNVTRTQAYLSYYQRNPEVHWSFLAHMVSRNGGYHMTDLISSSMTHLLTNEDRQKFFLFLERANSAIFADAFPQLLLYETSKQKKIPLRRLLRPFHISNFMAPIWEYFLNEPHSQLLTTALIINEQRMLEERVLKRSRHGEILRRLDFRLQELLGFTTVLFPYAPQKKLYSLTGLTVSRFADPFQRIETGKILYQLLFQHPVILKGVEQFANNTPHTGSREDYWDAIYTSISNSGDEGKVYSPTLPTAWPDRPVFPLPPTDWFTKETFINDIQSLPLVKRTDLTNKVFENVQQLKTINELKSFI
ncbi:DUF2515 family protein [Peribacillus sp. NPDC097675]|uniref:DUF2515 family protein n=1 Tax=Peribacillus sp. NPDC097675 TaxID=3390618 RepID=UPI003D03E22F